MQLGMIGLGRMGANMVPPLAKSGTMWWRLSRNRESVKQLTTCPWSDRPRVPSLIWEEALKPAAVC